MDKEVVLRLKEFVLIFQVDFFSVTKKGISATWDIAKENIAAFENLFFTHDILELKIMDLDGDLITFTRNINGAKVSTDAFDITLSEDDCNKIIDFILKND